MMQVFRRTLCLLIMLGAAARAVGDDAWPQFRGPAGDGSTDATGLPRRWSEKENIAWKTLIHGRGHSSPVIWEDQIWLTTATSDGKQLFAVCVDLASGKVVRDLKLFEVEKPGPIHNLNSHASPTPVIEAGRVYVHFGTYGTACLDTATGKTLWTRRDMNCDHFRGPGSSAFLCGDLLIVHYDGIDVQFLAALDKQSGKTVWKTDRSTKFAQADGDFHKAYSTPIVIDAAGRRQLISSGAQAAMAYDPASGEELWRVGYKGFSNVSRPMFDGRLVFLNTGFGKPELWAVRPDGHGDVTASHVVWKFAKSVPAKPSAVVLRGLIYMVNDAGIATCLDAAKGTVVWQERIGGQFSSSPLAAEGRLYAADQDGKTTVLAAGRKFEVLGVNQLDDGCMASPAVAGKAIFLRTKSTLYRIETKGK